LRKSKVERQKEREPQTPSLQLRSGQALSRAEGLTLMNTDSYSPRNSMIGQLNIIAGAGNIELAR